MISQSPLSALSQAEGEIPPQKGEQIKDPLAAQHRARILEVIAAWPARPLLFVRALDYQRHTPIPPTDGRPVFRGT